MAREKKSAVEEKAETRQALNKEGHTTDADEAVNAAIQAEANVRQSFNETLQEAELVVNTPDAPKFMPERWGNKRLTIASPDHMIDDPFYIPEYVETNENPPQRRKVATHRWIRGQFHILNADGSAKYRWCSRSRMPIHKRYGFRFVSYKKLFAGTGLFESGQGDTTWNGDVVLMEISMSGWEEMVRKTREMREWMEGSEGSDFFARAQDAGAPSFKEDYKRGVREYMT